MNTRALIYVAAAVWLGGCSMLPTGGKKESNRTYLIADGTAPPAADAHCGSIQVAGGGGASGFRSRRMAYMRSPVEIEYYAYSNWADAPARLLSEQLRRYLDRSGAFTTVLAAPVAARTDLQLELTDVMLVQRFSGESSAMQIALDARLYGADRAVVRASRRFALEEPAGADAQSGVQAANRAVAALLPDLLEFVLSVCARNAP